MLNRVIPEHLRRFDHTGYVDEFEKNSNVSLYDRVYENL